MEQILKQDNSIQQAENLFIEGMSGKANMEEACQEFREKRFQKRAHNLDGKEQLHQTHEEGEEHTLQNQFQ